MRRIVPLTALWVALALGAVLLPAGWQAPAWAGLALGYLALCTWGTVSLGSGIFVRAVTSVQEAGAKVALTFDDGPCPRATPALLDLLAERGVRATFFLVGERAEAHPDLVRRLVGEGHLVGNHSHRHRKLLNLYTRRALLAELERCQQALTALTGEAPRLYRPPFGLANHALRGVCAEAGLELIGWQVRGLDTGGRSAEAVTARVLRGVGPGGIVLLHDGGQDPARVRAIVGGVLDGLAARGLEPVRLDALLAARGSG